MLIGIIGIAMEVFRDDGWLKALLAKIFQSSTNMLAIPVIIIVVLWLINRITTSPNKSEMAKGGDLPMYIMMAFGTYYLFRLITSGSL